MSVTSRPSGNVWGGRLRRLEAYGSGSVVWSVGSGSLVTIGHAERVPSRRP